MFSDFFWRSSHQCEVENFSSLTDKNKQKKLSDAVHVGEEARHAENYIHFARAVAL